MKDTIFHIQQQIAKELIDLLEDEQISIQRSAEIAKEVLNIIDKDTPESALSKITHQLSKIPELKRLNLLD